MREMLKPENKRGQEHADKQQHKSENGGMVIPHLEPRRLAIETHEPKNPHHLVEANGIQQYERAASGLHNQGCGMAGQSKCVVVRHAA